MSPNSRPALARYLDRVRRLYPTGLPKAALRVAQSATVCALVVVTDKPSLPDPERDLLEAICVKGLKVPFDRCSVTVVRPRSNIVDALQSIRESRGGDAAVTIVFGAEGPLGAVQSSGASAPALLHTHALERIGADQGAKRDTWGHLKALLPFLSA